jgi:hypothetical protein
MLHSQHTAHKTAPVRGVAGVGKAIIAANPVDSLQGVKMGNTNTPNKETVFLTNFK